MCEEHHKITIAKQTTQKQVNTFLPTDRTVMRANATKAMDIGPLEFMTTWVIKTPINLENVPSRTGVSNAHDTADCEGSTARAASGVTYSDCTEAVAVIQI